MIDEVDSALRALIEREAVGRGDVEVVFDAPTREWAGRRNSPTIDVYLYDIREDLRRRDRGMINEYDADERRIVARHLPPRYFKLSYLVTAWTQRPEDEHRLLSTLLTTFLRFDALPEDLVTGSAGRAGAAGAGHGRPAAAGGPSVRRRLVRAGRGAQAVHRPGGQRTGGHRPALRDRPAGDRRRRGSASAAVAAGRRLEPGGDRDGTHGDARWPTRTAAAPGRTRQDGVGRRSADSAGRAAATDRGRSATSRRRKKST